jgi:D-amino-acid dehydrogenase
MDLSRAELEPFLAATGTLPMLGKEGSLQVYEGAAELEAARAGWDICGAHGLAFRHVTGAEMAGIQPGLAPRFTHGTFTPDWYSIADPRLYTLALAERFQANGGALERAEVTALHPTGEGVGVIVGGGARHAAHVVLAAGAFSHLIARSLGEKIPLETERGYNTTLPRDAFDVRTKLVFGGHGFVVSPLSTGVRVGGAVELGGLVLPPNFRRAEAMLKKAKSFLPGLKTEGGVQWMGFRPSLPDTLPVIGPARATPRVTYAFGHGHVGLTQSAGTARLVADLVTGQPPAVDLAHGHPYLRLHRRPHLR